MIRTATFQKWFDGLDDKVGSALIVARIDRLALGHEGDAKSVGGGVRELRINFGPGYRIYFGKFGTEIVILLTGGTKRTQDRDIAKAKELLKGYAK